MSVYECIWVYMSIYECISVYMSVYQCDGVGVVGLHRVIRILAYLFSG